MKRIITIAFMMLLLVGSAMAYDVNIPNPSSWYYPGKYMGNFVDWPTNSGSSYSASSSVSRYSNYGRSYTSRNSRYSYYDLDRSYHYGYYPSYDRAKFLGYDRNGRRIYSIRY